MRFEIGPLAKEHNPACAELLAAAFDRPRGDTLRLLEFFQAGYRMVAYGAWDGERLAAQYSCLVDWLLLPGETTPRKIGISMNMAVHPDYRGQGLVKQVALPVYETLAAEGAFAGVGFSNKEGVKVDRYSKWYGYRVIGKMVSRVALLSRRPDALPLRLSESWPDLPLTLPQKSDFIRIATPIETLRHRFMEHPALPCQFGIWEENRTLRGVAVYRPARIAGLKAVTLLAALGDDLPGLLTRWRAALWQMGIRAVHCLTTPRSPLAHALGQETLMLRLPYSRTPYYLTVKPLGETHHASLLDVSRWDCAGGDIL